MQLNNTQRAVLYTYITTTTGNAVATAWALNDMIALTEALNADSSVVIWNPRAPVNKIKSEILWANFTPQDTPDGTAIYQARSTICRLKQANIDVLIRNDDGQGFVDATKPGIRAGFQDALTALPSGTAGASKSGGWANVKIQLQRPATVIESLFAIGTGTTTTPADGVFFGYVDNSEISHIINTQGGPYNG